MQIEQQIITALKPFFVNITVNHNTPATTTVRAEGLRVDAPVQDKAKRYYVLELRNNEGPALMYQTDTRSMAENFIEEQLQKDSHLMNFTIVCGREMVKSIATSVTLKEN